MYYLSSNLINSDQTISQSAFNCIDIMIKHFPQHNICDILSKFPHISNEQLSRFSKSKPLLQADLNSSISSSVFLFYYKSPEKLSFYRDEDYKDMDTFNEY